MRYSGVGATSIDLFVSEMAAHSRYRVEVIAECPREALPAGAVHELPAFAIANTLRRARVVAELARAIKPDCLLMQQHLPSAAAACARVDAPVILQKHNFVRPPRRGGLLGALSERRNAAQYNALAGLTFVSHKVLAEFERHWPQVTTPRRVIANGVDFAQWAPRRERERTILVVGRASPDKGLLEAARGLRAALPRFAHWSATFIVSEPDRDPKYFAALQAELAPLGAQARLFANLTFPQVRAYNEAASIALVPSLWREPFGRTCLEAHAGGAAVISSGTGGLREVSGDAALYMPSLRPADIAATLATMVGDEALRTRLAAEGMARARRLFDVGAVAAELDDFCAGVIAAARAR